MERIAVEPREDWRKTAEQHGFTFHGIDGDPHWDESAYYRFTLRQIEDDLEDAARELEKMCFELVDRAVEDEAALKRLRIPDFYWDMVRDSWRRRERNLYGRMDLAYGGAGPAKLYDYNADTPTSLYESSIFQWVWLEQAMMRGLIPHGCNQFNSLHERLIEAFMQFGIDAPLHFACRKDADDDLGTIEYLADCARQAGLETAVMFIEDIGIDVDGRFTDQDDRLIANLFKLYPWESMMQDEFGRKVPASGARIIEPPWKAVLSTKAFLPLLWEMFKGHPNLLPAYFEDDPNAAELDGSYVRKPIFSHEGSNIEIVRPGGEGGRISRGGPSGAAGHIVQALHPLPDFNGHSAMCGCWLVASEPAGLCVSEDKGLITTDDARFIPHVILE